MSQSKITIGTSYQSINYGSFTVVKFLGKDKNRRFKFEIRFNSTGFITEATSDLIITGELKDYCLPTTCNIGYMGAKNSYFADKKLHKRAYNNWKNIINRCYNDKDKSYRMYGAKGVYVSQRWLCYKNFYDDIHCVEGFDYYDYINNNIELDKDIKSDKGNKHYSFQTCKFIKTSENRAYLDSVYKKSIIAVSPDGVDYFFYNISRFADEHNLTSPNIHNAINKNIKHKGWTFRKEKDIYENKK